MAYTEHLWGKARKLYEIEGYSYALIAENTGITKSAIEKRSSKEGWCKAKNKSKFVTALKKIENNTVSQKTIFHDTAKFLRQLEKTEIATESHILQFLSRTISDPDISIRDKLQAIRLLAETKQMVGSYRKEEEDDTLNNQMIELINSIKE